MAWTKHMFWVLKRTVSVIITTYAETFPMQYLSMYTREILTWTGYFTLSSAKTIFTPRSVEAVTGNELAHINLMIVQVALCCHSLCIFSYSVEWGVVSLDVANLSPEYCSFIMLYKLEYKLTNEIGPFLAANVIVYLIELSQLPNSRATQLSGHCEMAVCLRADSGPSFSANMVVLINYWRSLWVHLLERGIRIGFIQQTVLQMYCKCI